MRIEEEEWIGMPEFIQEDQKAYKKLVVRFDSPEDLEEFAKLIGQNITEKTKSIWIPELVRGTNSGRRYI